MLQTKVPPVMATSQHQLTTPARHSWRMALVATAVIIIIAIAAPSLADRYLPSGTVHQAELKRAAMAQRLVRAQQSAAIVASVPETERQRLAVALPQGVVTGDAELLVTIEALVENIGLTTIQKVRFIEAPTTSLSTMPSTLVKRTLEFTVAVPDYPRLQSLTEAIEHNLRLLDITSLNYKVSTGSATVTLQTYALP